MRTSVMTALTLAGVLAGAGGAAAQACVGVSAGEGGWTVAPVLRVRPVTGLDARDVRFYGGELAVNVPGRLGVEGGYAHARLNADGWSQDEYRVRPSLELVRAGSASLCLVAGAQLGDRRGSGVAIGNQGTWIHEREWRFPLGVAGGVERHVRGRTLVSLYAVPQALFIRADQLETVPFHGYTPPDVYRSNELGLEVGARVRRGPAFAGVSWLHATNAGPANPALGTLWTFTVGLAPGR